MPIKIKVTMEEWQFMGQMMVSIAYNQFPLHNLESAVLYEWYQDEIGKFQFPKTRQQQWKRISVVISLVRVLRWIPDNYMDPYWQIIKNELSDKLFRAVHIDPTLKKLNV